MKRYLKIEFQELSNEQTELLVAELSNSGFEGFEEVENGLNAFIPETDFNEMLLKEITEKRGVSFSKTVIEETNWNEVWESNFNPVVVDDFVIIRADFHEPITGVEHEIIITPKMSFGTGHHATTNMMIQQMREVDFAGKVVFDFGTGTGILAILAEKLGAEKILAVDNDDWSISNTEENLGRNSCKKVELIKADNAESAEQFDIILANINKNVIIENFSLLVERLSRDGILLLSGLLDQDEPDILQIAAEHSLNFIKKKEQNKWISLRFNY